MSPITNPTKPDNNNHSHVLKSASTGRTNPLKINVYKLMYIKAIDILIKFIGTEPIFFPADSYDKELIVQHTEVINANISP